MGLIDNFKRLANTNIKSLFTRKQEPEIITPSIPDKLPATKKEATEVFSSLFPNDTEKQKFFLNFYDESFLQQKIDSINEESDRADNLGLPIVKGSIQTRSTEMQDGGEFGYSTRDSLIQSKGITALERWKNDPKVKASLNVLATDVFSDPLELVPADDTEEALILLRYNQAIKDELQGNSMEGVLREAFKVAVSYQNYFGEMIPKFSEVEEFRDKRVLAQIMSRRPGLLEFITDDYDSVQAIHSLVDYDDYFDPDRFLLVSFNNEFSNPYGETFFSSTWKYVKAKELIYQDMCVYSNRFSQPIPLVEYDNDQLQAKAQQISDNLYSGANVALPKGVVASFLKAAADGQNPFLPILEWLDRQISLGICGQDLSQGSYAADKVISEGRKLYVADYRRSLEDIYFEQVIKRWSKRNFDPIKFPLSKYPKAKFQADENINTKEFAETVSLDLQNGALDFEARPSDLIWYRKKMNYPDLSEEEIKELMERANGKDIESEPEEKPIPDNGNGNGKKEVEIFNYNFN